MRVVFFGVDVLGSECLRALARSPHEVLAVVTLPGEQAPPPRPWWRRLLPGRAPMEGVGAIASHLGLPVLRPARVRDPDFIQHVGALRPDLLVVSCFDKILPADLLAVAPRGGVNVHPSLLPALRGPAPVTRAVWSGLAETGVSVHLMEATVDTGALLAQTRVAIRPDETAGALFDRLARSAAAPLLEALDALDRGRARPAPQVGEVTSAPFMTREEAHLDWSAGRERLMRTIRACNPFPGAFMETQLGNVAVMEAERTEIAEVRTPGTVLRVDPEGVVVQTSDGPLRCTVLRQIGERLDPATYSMYFLPGQILTSGNWNA